VGHVNWFALRAAGIRGVVFDKDNTLTAPYADILEPRVAAAVAACRAAFGPTGLVVMSNSAGGPDDAGYAGAERVEAALGLPVLRRTSKKPRGFDEVLRWFNRGAWRGVRAEEESSGTAGPSGRRSLSSSRSTLAPHELCMVGDRALTDVVFGNANGMLTVHVLPLTLENDHASAIAVRGLENGLLLPLVAGIGNVQPPPHTAVPRREDAARFVLAHPQRE